jgi:hypothetical protein
MEGRNDGHGEARGISGLQGQLWGARARDWADVQEHVHGPMYEAALTRVRVGAGTWLLDVGCGSGRHRFPMKGP